MNRPNPRGFTLIELMIVVAILALLSIIAIPNFLRFLAKAKRAEAYMNLGTIYTAQKVYWSEHNKYSDILMGPDGIGWKPEGEHLYTYGFVGSPGKNHVIGSLGADASGLSGSKADANSFVVVAAGDIDGDGKLDRISIDDQHKITILDDDLAD